jgi:hypothetical protein
VPTTVRKLRKMAREHCERLGHDLGEFVPIPSPDSDTNTRNQSARARCHKCGLYCFISDRHDTFAPYSGRHGLAAMKECTGNELDALRSRKRRWLHLLPSEKPYKPRRKNKRKRKRKVKA